MRWRAPLPCCLMTPKGNSRANGISERESNNEANCEADCNIARHNLAGAFSAGGYGDRKSPEHSRAALTRRCGTGAYPLIATTRRCARLTGLDGAAKDTNNNVLPQGQARVRRLRLRGGFRRFADVGAAPRR